MLAPNAFKYYKKNYDMFGQFNRGLSSVQYNLILAFFFLVYITGISWLIRAIVSPKVLSKKIKDSDIVNFVFSINQNTIRNILIKQGLDYATYDFITQPHPHDEANYFSSKFVFCCAIANAKTVYAEMQNAKNDEVLYGNGVRIIKLCGVAFIYDLLLNNIKVLIQYNDHTPYSVLLQHMAAEREIRTVYIQHAPVSERFPPLYHNLNVLFSPDSEAKYKVEHDHAKSFILFDVRFTEWNVAEDKHGAGVLICPNKLDDFDVVKDFAKQLSGKYSVTIRPHPADSRNWNEEGVYLVSRNNKIWTDIANAKYVITNESAVVLEAIYAGRLCYKCAFFSNSIDNYGFLRKGLLLREYASQADVIEDIEAEKITYNRQIFSYFAGDIDAKEQKIKLLKDEILHLRD